MRELRTSDSYICMDPILTPPQLGLSCKPCPHCTSMGRHPARSKTVGYSATAEYGHIPVDETACTDCGYDETAESND